MTTVKGTIRTTRSRNKWTKRIFEQKINPFLLYSAMAVACKHSIGQDGKNGKRLRQRSLEGSEGDGRTHEYIDNRIVGGEREVAMTGKLSIEVEIRDIERLEETAKKCFAVAKIHPYVADINIRVDETSLLCKLQKILRCLQRRLLHHF